MLSALELNGQIILNQSDFASAGDSVILSTSNATSIDFTTTGSSQVWDFSSLTPSSEYVENFTSIGFSPVQLTFGIFAPSSYQASYFIPDNSIPIDVLNGILPVNLSDVRSYQKSSSSAINKIGFSVKVNGIDVAFKSDSIEKRYQFPMVYQQNFETNGYTFIDLNPAADFKIKQYRYVTSTIDGFGQLILPNGSCEVLRLKRTILEKDSVYQTFFGSGAWFGLPVIQTFEYEWLAMDNLDAMLKIITNNSNGQNQIQSIEFQNNSNVLSLANNGYNESIILYPNPSHDILKLRSDDKLNQLLIIDNNGKIVLESAEDLNDKAINVESLSKGIYTLRVIGNEKIHFTRWIKE